MFNGTLTTQWITSFLGGGLGAGVVTFALNFWKGERDIRRANLERLYTAVHKFTKPIVSRRVAAFHRSKRLKIQVKLQS
jgi:hypothetical protein